MDPERELKLRRNRQAAHKSREKKKVAYDKMKEEIVGIQNERNTLRSQVRLPELFPPLCVDPPFVRVSTSSIQQNSTEWHERSWRSRFCSAALLKPCQNRKNCCVILPPEVHRPSLYAPVNGPTKFLTLSPLLPSASVSISVDLSCSSTSNC